MALRDSRPEQDRPAPLRVVPQWHPNSPRRWLGPRALVVLAILGSLFVVLAASVVTPLVVMAKRAGAIYNETTLPPPRPLPQTTYLYDRAGHVMTTLYAGQNRTVVPLDQIPVSMRNATVAIEDRDFYRHGGISPNGIVRAAVANLKSGHIVQGGSTIAQQYVKNMYTGDSRTFDRKIKEAILATRLEQIYTKNQILGMYLNTVYFGNGAYGVQAAAETYFGVRAKALNTLQAATLAATISAPAIYDPIARPAVAKARRNLVLEDMARQGYITPAVDASLERQPLKVMPANRHPAESIVSPTTGYFDQYVSQVLQRQFGQSATFTGGLRVTTTLDPRMQAQAVRAVSSYLSNPAYPSAAVVAIDPQTGDIRAMVGGRNFLRNKFNLAVQAHRQAGSAFKTFTLTAAMQQGISPKSVWRGPPELVIKKPECQTWDPKTHQNKPWDVHNFADESAGTMPLFSAIAHSVNTIFAQVVTTVGPANVAAVAHRMGISSPLQPVCSITLGSQGVTPLDMADAYATLAARGVHHSPKAVQAVRSSTGRVLYRQPTAGNQAISPNVADLVTKGLQGVIASGTGTAAQIGRPEAGKTGTAENFQDAWFCGYVPQLATCVWVGYPKNESTPMHNVDGFPDVFGGSIPAKIWHDFMSVALAGVPVQNFVEPDMSHNNRMPNGSVPAFPGPPAPLPPPSGGGGGHHHHHHKPPH